MAEIVNLNRARKRIAHAEQSRQAETNRAKFGRTRTQRKRDEEQTARTETTLDQHRLPEKDER